MGKGREKRKRREKKIRKKVEAQEVLVQEQKVVKVRHKKLDPVDELLAEAQE